MATTVFISYSRKDSLFVRRLHEALLAQDRQTWVDWEGIPPSAEWMKRIVGAIDATGAFVLVLSPDSLASSVCRDELAHAVQQHKRLIPVVCREVEAAAVPEAVAKMNWIFFREHDDFDTAVKTLVTAVDTDLEWVEAHTRLLVRAREWDTKGRENSLALRGKDLKAAEQWLTHGPAKQPQPTELQTLYILGSRKVATNRRYAILGSVMVGLVAVAILGTTTYFGRRDAARQQTLATAGRLTGDAELLRDQAAVPPGDNGLAERSVLLATEAGNTLAKLGTRSLQTDIAMRRSLPLLPNRVHRLTDEYGVYFKELVVTDERIVAVSPSLVSVGHWLANGEEVARRQVGRSAESVAISPDGKFIATVGLDHAKRVDIWDTTNLERLAGVEGLEGTVISVALSPEAKYLVADVDLWNATTNRRLPGRTRVWLRVDRELRELPPLPDAYALTFSPNGAWLAGTVESRLKVWAVPNASRARFEEVSLPDVTIISPRFSADGKHLLMRRGARITMLTVGDWRNWHELPRDTFAWALSPGGRFLAVTGEDDRTAVILDGTDGHEIVTFRVNSLEAVAFSPSSKTVAIAGSGNEIDVFRIARGGSDIAQLAIGIDVDDMAFGADETTLITVGKSATGVTQRQWTWGHSDDVPTRTIELQGEWAILSADARFVALAAGQKLVVAKTADGGTVREIGLTGRATAAALSPDGGSVTVATDDNAVLLWPTQGQSEPQRFAVPANVARDELAVGISGRPLIAVASSGSSRAGERFLVHVWQPPDMRERNALGGRDRSGFLMRPCALSADARYMASEELGIAVVKEILTDRIVATLGAASGGLCAFSPDATRLATAGPGVVRVWDTATETEIARIETDTTVSGLSFSPKNRYLATAGDGIARIWLLEPADLIALACERSTRNLSVEEKRSYFGDVPHQATCPALPVPEEMPRE